MRLSFSRRLGAQGHLKMSLSFGLPLQTRKKGNSSIRAFRKCPPAWRFLVVA